MIATFLGHQTWLIEHNKTKVLIDPLLCKDFGLTDDHRLEIYPPRRVDHRALNDIDIVFLSHEHSDHFDIESLNLLPRTAAFIVGSTIVEPVKRCIRNLGFSLTEVSDNAPRVYGDLTLRFYPADPQTAFWEGRVFQIHLEETINPNSGIFLAVDALVSEVFKDDVASKRVAEPKLVILSNNSRISPPGAFQSLENWGKLANKSNKKVGPLGVGVLTSVLTAYLDDFPARPPNIALCGGGFIKRFDGFAAFPFSEQEELSKLANALSLDVNVVGLKPGQSVLLDGSDVSYGHIDWVSIDTAQHSALTEELKRFIELERTINVKESVLPDFTSPTDYVNSLEAATRELDRIAKSLLLFLTGKKALALDVFKNRKLGSNRIVFVFRSDGLKLRSAYSLNFLSGKFEVESRADEKFLIENYPFGVDIPLVDFLGMVNGDLQIWDIVEVSIKSWFEGGIFDGVIPFFYGYYGENGSPELLEKVIAKKMECIS